MHKRNPFNCVRLSSVTERNPTQFDGLSSICSIKFDWFGNRTPQSSVFDLVQLPNSIEPNPWIEFDLLCWDKKNLNKQNPYALTNLSGLEINIKSELCSCSIISTLPSI